MRLPSLWSACFVFHSTFTLFDLCRGHVSPHSYVRRIWHVSLRSTRHQPPHRHNGIYCPPSGGSAAADTGFAGVFSVSRLFRGPVHLCSQILLTPRLLPCPSARCLPAFRSVRCQQLAARRLLSSPRQDASRPDRHRRSPLSPNARRLRLASLWLASRRLSRSYSAPERT